MTLVSLSVALFTLRGIAVLAGASWPGRTGVRVASVVVDTLLLSAGVGLWLLLDLNPTVQTWLGAKLALLVVYVAFGTLALKRAAPRPIRLAFFCAALATVGLMVGIALAHDPRGWFAPA